MNSATVAHSQPTFPRARGFQQLHFRFTRATFCVSVLGSKLQKVPMAFVEGLTVAVCNTLKWLKSSSETVRKGVRGNAPSMDLSGIRTIERAQRSLLASRRPTSRAYPRLIGQSLYTLE